jgi:transcriptional regulator of nitric oxide reductase
LLAVALVVATVSVAWAADRIFTNPKPDAHLKKLFPQAVAFSPLEGTPLHFKAYGVDPKTRPDAPPIGYAFWTTDIVPQERGYHGAIHFLVGLDLTGIITGVVLDYDSEPYGYFSVQPPAFVAQFKGKSVREPFRLGQDVDMVSRASITMNSAVRAIRDSSRAMARQFLNPASVKQQ